MKKIIFILSLILICISCTEYSTREKKEIIISKDGFNDYKIGETKIEKVIQDLGTSYKEIEDRIWSYQLIYKDLGLSFSYGTGDIIHAIEFYPPFNGKTEKGIILNVSTMTDVRIAYDSLDWYITSPWQEWCSEYPGIEFCVTRDTSLKKWPLNERIHEQKKITRIIVIDNYEDFE